MTHCKESNNLSLPSGKLTMSLYKIPPYCSVSCQSVTSLISILWVHRSSFTLSIMFFFAFVCFCCLKCSSVTPCVGSCRPLSFLQDQTKLIFLAVLFHVTFPFDSVSAIYRHLEYFLTSIFPVLEAIQQQRAESYAEDPSDKSPSLLYSAHITLLTVYISCWFY